MIKKDYPKESVIDIAMSVMSDMAKPSYKPTGGNKPLAQTKDYVPDLRKVEEVSDDYISFIIDGKPPAKKPMKLAEESQPASVNYEDKVQSLVTRLSDLLKEAKDVLTEMTTAGNPTMVGHLGVNLAGPTKKKKKKVKYGYPDLNTRSKNRKS